MTACPRCAVANPHDARFCKACGASLTAGCRSCGAALPDDARFCPQCGIQTAPSAEAPEMIKLVTILFADVVGSTAQAEAMAPEDTRALMAEFFEAMSEEIEAEGGTIERLIGDAIMADFGVPIAREDDPLRAVRAARRMLARLQRFNTGRDPGARIRMRIGINTGEVSTGGSLGEQLMVMGDAVNVAARLQQMAEPDTLLIGERTAELVKNQFELEKIQGLQMKGKVEAVSAYVVRGERHEEPRLPSPFVGRGPELEMLHDIVNGARRKRSGVVATIVGEPGAGKSRLIQAVIDSIDVDVKVVQGACSPFGHNPALRPFREILGAEASISGTDPPELELDKIRSLVDRLPLDPSIDPGETALALAATFDIRAALDQLGALDPRATHRASVVAWRALLQTLSQQKPLVVVIEDLQWADPATLDMIGVLSQSVLGPVAFMCATRPEFLDEHKDWLASLADHASIRLRPLDKQSSQILVSALLENHNLPGALIEDMLDKAEGNPFFLEEIVRRLIDFGQLTEHDGRWVLAQDSAEINIPDNVRLAIVSRIDLLPQDHRHVLQQAAVIGRAFWSGAVQELTDISHTDGIMETLMQRQFIAERFPSIVPGERQFSFVHALIREVAYEGLPPRARGKGHAAAAAWVEKIRGEAAEESAELLAYHYDQAFLLLGEDQMRREARLRYLEAAEKAVRRFSVAQAETLGKRAVELSSSIQERIEAFELLGDLYVLASRGDEAWSAFTHALKETGQEARERPDVTTRIAAKAAIVPTRLEGVMTTAPPPSEVETVIRKGLETAGHGQNSDRVVLLSSLAFFKNVYAQGGSSETEAAEALDIAEKLGDPNLLSLALDAAYIGYFADAEYGRANEIVGRRLELIPALSNVEEICDIYGVAAYTNVYIGRYADAVGYASAVIDRSRESDPSNYVHGLIWRAQARFMTGDWDGALDDQLEIERVNPSSDADIPSLSIRGYGVAAFVHELRGEDQLADHYLEIMRGFRKHSDKFSAPGPLALPARALAHRGLLDEARTWLTIERSVFLAGHLESMCEVVAEQGDWDYATYVVQMAREESERGTLLALPFFADRLEGRMAAARAELEVGAEMLERSASGFVSIGARWEAAWSNLLLAETLSDMPDQLRATPTLRTALSTFESLGSARETDRARGLIERAGYAENR